MGLHEYLRSKDQALLSAVLRLCATILTFYEDIDYEDFSSDPLLVKRMRRYVDTQ